MKPRFLSQLFTANFTSSSNPKRFLIDHVQLSLLLTSCGRDADLRRGSSLHGLIIKNKEHYDPRISFDSRNVVVVWNSLIGMYVRSGVLRDARKVFVEMPVKDTISWNTIVGGYLGNGEVEEGFGVFTRMWEMGVEGVDQATLTTLLSGCDEVGKQGVVGMIHGLVVGCGFEGEVTVGNALITSYFKCGCVECGKMVFDQMKGRNVITWTAVISGFGQNEMYEHSLEVLKEMFNGSVCPNGLTYLSVLTACAGLPALSEGRQVHAIVLKLGFDSDFCIESALMDMYTKCGCMEDALQIYHSADKLDEVSMTVIMVGFAQNGFEEEAVQMFQKILKLGISIDANMISAVLGLFGDGTNTLSLGLQIHALVIKRKYGASPFVCNGLINMYSKCGHLDEATKIFFQMPKRNSVSWNSMIAAFARHGDGLKVLRMYEQMLSEGEKPTEVTFLSLLHACSHMGLLEKGTEYLDSMSILHGLNPRMEHYACVVDMLGRAGLLAEARTFIENLPVKPGPLVWQALLGACSIRGDSKMGKYVAEQLLLADPDSPSPYVQLANIYSSEKRWRERAGTMKRMKEMGVAKETGGSWIEMEKRVHGFVVSDKMHPEADMIYGLLSQLFRHMSDEVYERDNSSVQQDMQSDIWPRQLAEYETMYRSIFL
ncbi:hypothetical protein Droror1_Dr00024877 [Drosera rotundifolia]